MEKVNKDRFQEVVNNNKAVLVDFYADWCGPCKMVTPILEQIAAENAGIVIIKVDVDAEHELTSSFGIQSIPAVLFFIDGELKQALTGFQPKAKFEKLINIAL